MNEIPHPGFDKPEEYEIFTTTNGLEEYASRAGFDYVDDIKVDEPGHRWNDHDVEYAYRDGIIAGANWQKERDEQSIDERWEELQTSFREINEAFEAGKAEQKEQMLKEAVEGDFMLNPYPIICLDDCKNYDFKEGDKVRIIIVKEDEK